MRNPSSIQGKILNMRQHSFQGIQNDFFHAGMQDFWRLADFKILQDNRTLQEPILKSHVYYPLW